MDESPLSGAGLSLSKDCGARSGIDAAHIMNQNNPFDQYQPRP
jgi:hypothetical protein